MKEKKKMSLAMQIFIALVLAIIAGLLMQNYADFAESYIKPFQVSGIKNGIANKRNAFVAITRPYNCIILIKRMQ